MPDFTTAISLLRKPIDDLYSSAIGPVKNKMAIFRSESKLKLLHKKLWETQRVKTIWNTDRALSLAQIFYPVSVTCLLENQLSIQGIKQLSELKFNHCIIYGTVGQGKSIMMRYLLGTEIKSGAKIPVLCDLRDVQEQKLESFIMRRLELLADISIDDSVFTHFAANGKLSILLDGFDEIDPNHIPKLMREIEDISYKYPSCRIIITSRPDTECKYLTSFTPYKLCQLAEDDLERFYKKITKSDEFTKRLLLAIKKSPTKIKSLIKTPLLATLLAISYRSSQRIPTEFSEFYEELFQILLVRHDSSKLGWQRKRKTKLTEKQIQQSFEAFCFSARKKQLFSIDRDLAVKMSEDCLSHLRFIEDSTNFLYDVKSITCLMLEEDKKYTFIHSSVPEFFAARFIKTRPEASSINFYTQLLTNEMWRRWSEELLFLKQLDGHRANKYFYLPDFNKTINEKLKIQDEVAQRLLGLSVKKETKIVDKKEIKHFVVSKKRSVITYHWGKIESAAYDYLFTQKGLAGDWKQGFKLDETSMERSYIQIANDKVEGGSDMLIRYVVNYVNSLMEEMKNIELNLHKDESISDFTDIFV